MKHIPLLTSCVLRADASMAKKARKVLSGGVGGR
jgi:hypothetical protein